MNVIARVLIAAIVVAAGLKATAYALLAALDFPKRVSVYFTEPQMVNLSRCVQQGESLYPDWRTFPYVVNVFTPGYFWIVGGIGKMTDASIEGLQFIGRGVTIFFSLLGALLVAWTVRRGGAGAMIAAACIAIGSGVSLKFGWMARPDLVADVLGFAGFLAATSSATGWLAIALLTGGVVCKQTTGLYLLAAVVALSWQKRRSRAVAVFVGSVAGMLIVLAVVFKTGESRVFSDILLEASSPWRWDHWTVIATRLMVRSGEVVILCAIGAMMWINALRSGDSKSISNAKRWLSLLLLATCFDGVGSAKFGSDVNYFLNLRFVAAAAVAEIIEKLREPSVRMGTSLAGALSFLATILWLPPVWSLLSGHEAFDVGRRMRVGVQLREILGIAEIAKVKRVFTNSDDVALRIGNPFVDSFVFKMLVDTGRLDPTVLKSRLERGDYDLVVTTAAVDDSRYIDSAFGMPRGLAAVITERYDLVSKTAFTYYRPKSKTGGP